jgi:hypothetical protein
VYKEIALLRDNLKTGRLLVDAAGKYWRFDIASRAKTLSLDVFRRGDTSVESDVGSWPRRGP